MTTETQTTEQTPNPAPVQDKPMNKKQRREAARAKAGKPAPAPVASAKPAKATKSGLPALPRTRKPKTPKDCACGCGKQTKGGRFIPGHDARLHAWVLRVERGVCGLDVVEKTDGKGTREAVAKLVKSAA